MILNDLVQKFNWNEISPRLLELYPSENKSIVGYARAFNELKYDTVLGETELVISIYPVRIDGEEPYENVCGVDRYNDWGWAIEYTDWSEILSMWIAPKTWLNYSELDIVCHLMYEITWSGYTNKEVQEEQYI